MSLLSCRHTLTNDVPQTLFLDCCSFVFCRCTSGLLPILFPCLRPILTLKYQKWFRTSKQLNILTFANVDSNIRQLTLNITLLTNAARRFSDLETSQTPVISTAHHLVIALCTGKVVNLDVSIVVKMNITHGFAP